MLTQPERGAEQIPDVNIVSGASLLQPLHHHTYVDIPTKEQVHVSDEL